MKLGVNNSAINFCKKLVALTRLRKGDSYEQAKIYKLDRSRDKSELERQLDSDTWEGATYTPEIKNLFLDGTLANTYAILNSKNDYVGLCSVNESLGHPILYYIETAPKYSLFNAEKKEYKYIGETMLAFLAQKAKMEQGDLEIHAIRKNQNVKDFYFKHSGFEKNKTRGAILRYEQLDDLIQMNARHLGSSVDLDV